jgi:hypothetical protein
MMPMWGQASLLLEANDKAETSSNISDATKNRGENNKVNFKMHVED